MFGVESVGRGLSFTKILGGISKTLSIANQVIPLYQQAKPMIQNARTAFWVLKEFSAPTKEVKQVPSKVKPNNIPQKKTVSRQPTQRSANQPVFFI